MFCKFIGSELTPRITKASCSTKRVTITEYSKQIEGLYQNIRSFRHDYANILTSLKIGIDCKDIEMISSIYHKVLKDSGKVLRGEKFNLARLRNINDLPLKSLLFVKLSEAQRLSIPVSIEIGEPISIKNIELIDFLTLVSILIDNAIEGAAESGIVLCFFEQFGKQILIVQNDTFEKLIFPRFLSEVFLQKEIIGELVYQMSGRY